MAAACWESIWESCARCAGRSDEQLEGSIGSVALELWNGVALCQSPMTLAGAQVPWSGAIRTGLESLLCSTVGLP